jgi:predicted RNA-binding Zn ribbon-like protein
VVAPAQQQTPGRQAVIGTAPGRLELVRGFVNTLDIEADTDELSSPGALEAWLLARGLTEPAPPGVATEDDLRQAVATREALRSVLLTHVPGQRAAGPPAADLRSLASGLPVRLMIGDDGTVRAAPGGDGPAAGMAGLLLIAAEAATAGTWSRLKVCGADDCRWAFYDRSPTRSGCWCSMAVCGSRSKSRAFRRRAAARR